MKQVIWATKKGRALIGNVIEEMEWTYIVEVTSWESKKDKNLVGKKVIVNRAICTDC